MYWNYLKNQESDLENFECSLSKDGNSKIYDYPIITVKCKDNAKDTAEEFRQCLSVKDSKSLFKNAIIDIVKDGEVIGTLKKNKWTEKENKEETFYENYAEKMYGHIEYQRTEEKIYTLIPEIVNAAESNGDFVPPQTIRLYYFKDLDYNFDFYICNCSLSNIYFSNYKSQIYEQLNIDNISRMYDISVILTDDGVSIKKLNKNNSDEFMLNTFKTIFSKKQSGEWFKNIIIE